MVLLRNTTLPPLVSILAFLIATSALAPANANASALDRMERRIRIAPLDILPRALFGSDDGSDSSTSDSLDGSDSATSSTPTTTAAASSTSSPSSPSSTSSSSDTAAAAASSSAAAQASSSSLSKVAAAASSSAAQQASLSASQAAASASQADAAASSSAARAASLASASAASRSAAASSTAAATAAASSFLATSTDAAGSIVVLTSTVQASTTQQPSATATSEADNSGSHTALIAGVSGAVGGLALLGGLVFLLMRFTGKRSGFDDGDADIKWPELKHAEGDVAAMQPLPARRTGGAGFDMGEDTYSDAGRLDDEDVDGRRSMTMSNIAGAGGYGDHMVTVAGAYGGSTVHLTGAGAYGGSNTSPYESNQQDYNQTGHEYGAAPDYLSAQGNGNNQAYYDDYSPSGASDVKSQSGRGGATESVAGGSTVGYPGAMMEPDLSSPHAYMNGYDDGGYGVASPPTNGASGGASNAGPYQDYQHQHQQAYSDVGVSSPQMNPQAYMSSPQMNPQAYNGHQQPNNYQGQYQNQQDYHNYGYR
ncbi:hypothetical protein BCV69DRAFT_68517 [Microstroma glucosiphilum]|uniref:REJ domain-containing protein n=1 Tax=Pseudomicrostroma glucosiphilum TaxID=1684307 RepID=A0A316U2K3_9BASI|nr:hypothetical protein BCV69DRAFT_68517 [Pseudomicrostroma glucosiphilum]PWN18623.1 hypothetical protein BCV69DRAFT_68517 [Pseudomicrostroma glucosiphilum]